MTLREICWWLAWYYIVGKSILVILISDFQFQMRWVYPTKHTAAGLDGLYPEFIKNCVPRVKKWLVLFFSYILASGQLPPYCKWSKIIALLKSQKLKSNRLAVVVPRTA